MNHIKPHLSGDECVDNVFKHLNYSEIGTE